MGLESFENTAFYHGVVSLRQSFPVRESGRLFHCEGEKWRAIVVGSTKDSARKACCLPREVASFPKILFKTNVKGVEQ